MRFDLLVTLEQLSTAVFTVSSLYFWKRPAGYLSLSFLQWGEVAGVKRKRVFERPVAQDVTTLPLTNEGDISTGQSANTHTHIHTYMRAHSEMRRM